MKMKVLADAPIAGGSVITRLRRMRISSRTVSVQLAVCRNVEMRRGLGMAELRVSKTFRYVNLQNMEYLLRGLTFDVLRCAEVLDSTFIGLNEKTQIPDNIVSWNRQNPSFRGPLAFPNRGRIIVKMTQMLDAQGPLVTSIVLEAKEEKETAPVVHFEMRLPTLNIPMRVEIPLRALVNGSPRLEGTYTVYLHTLLCDDGQEFVYYGITKRGWNKRFTEHLESALDEGARRMFPVKLKELMSCRGEHIRGESRTNPMLAGLVSSICSIGLNEDSAMDAEEYLVDKYSLSSKHSNGLNMIPGGREGIRVLRKLSLGGDRSLVESDDREELLDEYLKVHPQFGKPNPGVAAAWEDPAYAEAVICGRENRLSADKVREIRYLAAMGKSADQIKTLTGASDNGQVSRVLAGRTYSRIL